MAPRTTYSRVNTGSSPASTVGTEGKSAPPRGMEFLPAKVAHEEKISMATMMSRPTMQELVKEAMAGTLSKVNVTAEATRALGGPPPQEKTAEARPSSVVPTEVIEKTAQALEYLAKKAADPGSAGVASPGVGPGQGAGQVMQVLEAESSEENIDAGEQGQATTPHVVPKDPPMRSFPDSNGPANVMDDNLEMEHPEQPVDPMHNEHASNAAQKQAQANLNYLRKIAGGAGKAGVGRLARMGEKAREMAARGREAARKAGKAGVGSAKKYGPAAGVGAAAGLAAGGAAGYAAGKKKNASALLLKNAQALGIKLAEDAINPAQISAGAASAQGAEAPQGASAAQDGPIPPEPSDVNSQKRFISDNMAAINYTRRQAKADPKRDLGQILTEPALSAATDKTLNEAFNHTNEAGAKIASAQLTKTAAAHALLLRLAEEAEQEKTAGGAGKAGVGRMARAATKAREWAKGHPKALGGAALAGTGAAAGGAGYALGRKKPKEKNSNISAALSTPAGQTGMDTSGGMPTGA
jgi:hypothetical protein